MQEEKPLKFPSWSVAGFATAWYFVEIKITWSVDTNMSWSVDITDELKELLVYAFRSQGQWKDWNAKEDSFVAEAPWAVAPNKNKQKEHNTYSYNLDPMPISDNEKTTWKWIDKSLERSYVKDPEANAKKDWAPTKPERNKLQAHDKLKLPKKIQGDADHWHWGTLGSFIN